MLCSYTCCLCAVELGGGELQEPTAGEHRIATRSTVSVPSLTDGARTSTPETSPVAMEAPPPAPTPPPIGPVHHYHSSPRPPVAPPPPGLLSAALTTPRGVRAGPPPPPPPPLPSVPPALPLPPRNIPRHAGANLPPAAPPPPVARSPTPPMVTMLIEMGFDLPIARIAVERCENFDNTRPPDENIDVLLNWILDHPDAVADEERRYCG